jgi:SAM-dependent MidA family methyltransferase
MDELRQLIRRSGPVPFSTFMDAALYGPSGFYTTGGGAGRRRDFITSPEVGPLFGAVLANALDSWWESLGRPDPFVVGECGAGPGTLCRDVLRAVPSCLGSLRYVLVDAAEPMRALHRCLRVPLVEPFELFGSVGYDSEGDRVVGVQQGPLVCSLSELPTEPVHVVLANELLDNLPFDIAQRHAHGWHEVRVGLNDSAFTPMTVSLDDTRAAALESVTADAGATVPLQPAAARWVGEALSAVASTHGVVLAIDYAGSTVELAERAGAWLRTYRGHERGVDPFTAEGSCDITADVDIQALTRVHAPTHVYTQTEFLRAHGITDLVETARATWSERAALGDLPALAARSRIGEAEALCDPNGLGAFTVMEWRT